MRKPVPHPVARRLLDLHDHVPLYALENHGEDEINHIGLESGGDSGGGGDGDTDFGVWTVRLRLVGHVNFESGGSLGGEVLEHGFGEADAGSSVQSTKAAVGINGAYIGGKVPTLTSRTTIGPRKLGRGTLDSFFMILPMII